MLWVKWVHEKYLKQNDWWSYQASYDSSWSWKKIVSTKEVFKQEISQQAGWTWQGNATYTISKGYNWLLGGLDIKRWSKIVWARTVTPRHAFILWVTMHDKLPVKSRLMRFTNKIDDPTCVLCNAEAEDADHLFFQCT